MRPVNQPPLSLMAMKRSPLGSRRRPDKPPKPRKREVRISPLRYSSEPNRTWARSRVSKDGSGRALTSIETGAVTEYSSGVTCFGGFCTAVCAAAIAGSAAAESPAAAVFRKRRRLRGARMLSEMQAARPHGRRGGAMVPAEELGELFGDGAA